MLMFELPPKHIMFVPRNPESTIRHNWLSNNQSIIMSEMAADLPNGNSNVHASSTGLTQL